MLTGARKVAGSSAAALGHHGTVAAMVSAAPTISGPSVPFSGHGTLRPGKQGTSLSFKIIYKPQLHMIYKIIV